MSTFTDKGIVQKIVIATVFVILFNFIVPNISFAKPEEEKTAGGILFEPIKDLLLVIGDGVMSVAQKHTLGMDTSFVTLSHKDAGWKETALKVLGAIGGALIGITLLAGSAIATLATGGLALPALIATAATAIGGTIAGGAIGIGLRKCCRRVCCFSSSSSKT